MRLFLQLNLAATRATNAESVVLSREDEDQLETCSELSGAPSSITAFSTAITDALTGAASGTIGVSSKTPMSEVYRMGLRVDQRRDLKRVMGVISNSIERFSHEVQETQNENQTLSKENQSLETEIVSLKQMINEGKSYQDQWQEELNKALKSKEEALQKSVTDINRLETSLAESRRYCESLEANLMAVKDESKEKLEQHESEKALVESKLQQQIMRCNQLSQELEESKERNREDNLVLAKEVKSLRQEKKSLSEKLKEQDHKLMEFGVVHEKLVKSEAEKVELKRKIEQMEMKFRDQKISFETQIQIKTDKLHTQMTNEQNAIKQIHYKEVEALKNIISNLEQSRPVSNESGVELVINIASNEDLDGVIKENLEFKEKEELLAVELEELSGLKSAMKQVLQENKQLKDQLDSQSMNSVPNGTTPVNELSEFSDLVEGLYSELHDCYNTMRSLEQKSGVVDADEANVIIEQVADSNGRLQLLKVRVEEMKPTFPSLPLRLISSVNQLLSDSIQKCLEINEMKMDAFLSRNLNNQGSELGTKNPVSSLKRISPRQTDSISEASSMKSLFGGIGAKMSQGSQGFMSFMQRGGTGNQSTPPPEQQSHQEETA
eukprot:g6702.t1